MGCKYVKNFDFESAPMKKAKGGAVDKPAPVSKAPARKSVPVAPKGPVIPAMRKR